MAYRLPISRNGLELVFSGVELGLLSLLESNQRSSDIVKMVGLV